MDTTKSQDLEKERMIKTNSFKEKKKTRGEMSSLNLTSEDKIQLG